MQICPYWCTVMPTIPDDTDDIVEFVLDHVLYGIDLDPDDSQRLLSYMNERHAHLFGPHSTYFVLGSYESPFKYRLDDALDEFNYRYDSYAFLLATQPTLDVSASIPALKVKFYVHALYADAIPLILEHNTGGALAEFGRADIPLVLEKTHLFPRAHTEQYDGEAAVASPAAVRARAVELAYHAADLDAALADLADRAAANDIDLSVADLEQHLADELGVRDPSYSGVLTDGFVHFEELDRCFSWTTTDQLRAGLQHVP